MVHVGNKAKAKIDLLNIAYISSIGRNLIFVPLSIDFAILHFGDKEVYLFHNSVLVGAGTLYKGLHMIYCSHIVESSSNTLVMNIIISKRYSILWPLGHISKQMMERIIKVGFLHNLEFFSTLKIVLIMLKENLRPNQKRENWEKSTVSKVNTYIHICPIYSCCQRL